MKVKLSPLDITFLGHHFQDVLYCAEHFVTFWLIQVSNK